ncbi:MAG: signal transduction histidine kinase, partial [Patiriisocius sp.]
MKSTISKIQKDIEVLLEKAYELRVSDLSKSISLTEEALLMSRENNFLALTAHSLSKLSLYKMIQGASGLSLILSLEAIEIYKKLDDDRGIAKVNYSIAGIHYKSNNYHLGMVYLLDCLMTFRKYKDYHNESRSLKSLGAIYEFLGDQPNAKEAYEAAIKAAKLAGDKKLESNAYNPLSGLFLKLLEPEKAMELIQLSVALKQEMGDVRGEAFAIYGRGKVHLYYKDYIKAKKDIEAALQIHIAFNDQLGITMANIRLARLAIAQKENKKAKNILKEVIEFCELNDILVFKDKCYSLIYTIYKEEGNIEKALKYLEFYVQSNKKTKSSQVIKVIKNYEAAAKIKSSEREARLELEKAAIELSKKRVEQSGVIKQEFLSAMSHEIRTPLNAVTGIITLLEDRSSESEQQLLTSLRFSSKNLLRIIDDILDFSKLESNKMVLEKRPTYFRKFIVNTRETYIGMAKEKGLKLQVSLDAKVAEAYRLDETKLFQILGNLLSNAIKYTDKGRVIVSVSLKKSLKHTDLLLFKVSDTGIGISKADQVRLFESFYMPRAITTRSLGGTGLGLAIVKKLVELHGSSITIESE